MAFTDPQKAAIRQYMGFSELFHDLDPRLEGQMQDLGARAPDAVARVQATLVALADIDARLACALNNLDVTQAEDVKFAGELQLDALRTQGRMLIQQMSIVFFLTPMRDYYATGEMQGGGLIPLG